MRIGYFGDGPWATIALEKLAPRDDVEIAFIVPRYHSLDDGLTVWAERLDVPLKIVKNVNYQDFVDWVRQQKVDLLVSMSFDQIVRGSIRDTAPLGFINCHAGALPFYRGRNTLNWAIINGEERFGVTVHHIDDGIDTGDIIIQRFDDISPTDDYGTILTKAETLCAETLVEAIVGIAADNAQRTEQASIHPVGFYCGRRRPGDEWIDWSWTSERIHNFIRGITSPGPGARTRKKEKEIALLRSGLIENAPAYLGTCGEVIGIDSDGIVVKTGDTTLRLLSVAEIDIHGQLGEKKIPRYAIGTRFGAEAREGSGLGLSQADGAAK
jgi:methionyl-tRNA formyltransferase